MTSVVMQLSYENVITGYLKEEVLWNLHMNMSEDERYRLEMAQQTDSWTCPFVCSSNVVLS